MTVSVKKKVSFSWISLLLLILLLQSSGAIEAPEDFQWSKIFEEASKIDGKAPLTNVWNLFGDDPIKQHELELNHQIREGPPMVNFYRQYSPRVHQTDPQSSSLHQPNIESRFSSGANEERENTGFGYLGSNSGPMGANNDMYSLEHPHMAKNLQFTSLGDHLHNNFNENFNHIIGGTHPEQRFPTLPELSAGLYHDPEQDKHLHISSIQGNNDYQLYDNCVGKIQNKNLNALDSIHNYQNYDTNLQYDRSTELDKIYANLFSQDYGIYHNQKIGNAENRNHYNGGQNTQDNVCETLNPSHEKTLHLNLEHNEGPDLFQNVDFKRNLDKKSQEEKHHARETLISKTFSDDFHGHKKNKNFSKSRSKGSSEKSNNDREFPTIYSDIVASYKPQQSDMKLNYHNSAGAHSPDTQSSSLYWPGIEERLSKKANEVIDKSWSGDLGGSSGYISSNSDIYSLENPHFTEHNPFTSSREVPDFHFKEKMNHINGGILPEPRFQSLPDLSAELYKYSKHGHNIHVSGIEGDHGHQVHDKNHKSLDSDHHFQDYYYHLDQALQNFPKNPDSNYVHPINQNYDTGYYENKNNVENVILNYGAQSIQQQNSDHSNMSHQNDLYLNLEKNNGPDFIKNVEVEQNFKNTPIQKKNELLENVKNSYPKKRKNSFQIFTSKSKDKQLKIEEKNSQYGSKSVDSMHESDHKLRKNKQIDLMETPRDVEFFFKDSVTNQQQDKLKFNVPDKYLPLLTQLDNFLLSFSKSNKIENESQFINKVILHMGWEKRTEIVNYALEYYFSISKIPCMSSKESFLEVVSLRQKILSWEKSKRGADFAMARDFYTKKM